MYFLLRTLIWQISFCNDIKWIKKKKKNNNPACHWHKKYFPTPVLTVSSDLLRALQNLGGATLNSNLWVVSFYKGCPWKRKTPNQYILLPFIIFSQVWPRCKWGPRWLAATFIWSDTVSLGISDHFHTAHNIRALLFVKQQMRLMPSSGEEFNIIR